MKNNFKYKKGNGYLFFTFMFFNVCYFDTGHGRHFTVSLGDLDIRCKSGCYYWRINIEYKNKNIFRTISIATWLERKRLWRKRWQRLGDIVSRRKIYLLVDSTDCDHYQVISAYKFRNIFEAEGFIESVYDGAEGPTYVTRISKSDYENHDRQERDHVLEAHENGHPYSVRH